MSKKKTIKIKDPKLNTKDDLYYCGACGAIMEDVWENNGFTAPDPEHWEIVAVKCTKDNCPQKGIEL